VQHGQKHRCHDEQRHRAHTESNSQCAARNTPVRRPRGSQLQPPSVACSAAHPAHPARHHPPLSARVPTAARLASPRDTTGPQPHRQNRVGLAPPLGLSPTIQQGQISAKQRELKAFRDSTEASPSLSHSPTTASSSAESQNVSTPARYLDPRARCISHTPPESLSSFTSFFSAFPLSPLPSLSPHVSQSIHTSFPPHSTTTQLFAYTDGRSRTQNSPPLTPLPAITIGHNALRCACQRGRPSASRHLCSGRPHSQ
jgi:hypothetical protein